MCKAGCVESMNLPSFRSRRIRGSSSWVLLLCLLTLTLCVPAAVVTTIDSPDGDTVECTDILSQPSFIYPLLKGHTLQEVPSDLPNTAKNEEVSGWQIWHRAGLKCPEGTIPIRRLVYPDNPGVGGELPGDVHEYALAHFNSTPKIYGTKVTMSVGHPKVANHAGELSVSQLWLSSGSFEAGDLNTIEAGWEVFPNLYYDNQPRLFIFWTKDAYTSAGWYNLRTPGFVQTSRNVLMEGAIDPNTEVLTIQIWKDPKHGNWWFSIGPNSDTLVPVGYWPSEVFTRLTDYAQNVEWGGEVLDKKVSGLHTTTQMGTGYLPSSARAAYMRDLEITVDANRFVPINDFTVQESNPAYYKLRKTSTTSFTYGGPEGSEHAGAVHLSVSLIFLYLCFIFLLFF